MCIRDSYYPRYDRSTPQHIQAVIDGYAGELYPEFYDQQSGLLRFPQSQGQLKAHVTPIDAKLIARLPNIEFFQKRNCLLYTSDAADERSREELGGPRIIKKQKT